MKRIWEVFENPYTGRLSHKRVIAIGCFVVATVIAFTTGDIALASLFAGGFAGVSAITMSEKSTKE